jgi:hypothetical protein
MLDGNHHQGLHEPAQHDLTGHGLRSLNHRREVELVKGLSNRGVGKAALVPRAGAVAMIELTHFAQRPNGGSSSERFEDTRLRLIAAGEIELRRKLVRNALVLNEAVSRADRMACS